VQRFHMLAEHDDLVRRRFLLDGLQQQVQPRCALHRAIALLVHRLTASMITCSASSTVAQQSAAAEDVLLLLLQRRLADAAGETVGISCMLTRRARVLAANHQDAWP
jgi:hypothetical protein